MDRKEFLKRFRRLSWKDRTKLIEMAGCLDSKSKGRTYPKHVQIHVVDIFWSHFGGGDKLVEALIQIKDPGRELLRSTGVRLLRAKVSTHDLNFVCRVFFALGYARQSTVIRHSGIALDPEIPERMSRQERKRLRNLQNHVIRSDWKDSKNSIVKAINTVAPEFEVISIDRRGG